MNFSVTILGHSAALPAHKRHLSAQVLNCRDKLFLIDCGEATQMRLRDCGIKFGKIEHIFISHLHGDHYFGLVGLLTSYQLLQRDRPLHIYGPKELKSIIDIQINLAELSSFDLFFHVVESDQESIIFENEMLSVETIPLLHRIPTNGFLFKEKLRLGNMKKAKIDQYSIPFQAIPAIKSGEDFITDTGEMIPHQELVGLPPAPRSYAYCSDTAYNEQMISQIANVDLLYHESTFLEESKDRAEKTMHSTAQQAALIARKGEVKKLILGHFSGKYPSLKPFLQEARAVFPESYIAEEGATFQVEWARQVSSKEKVDN